MLMTARMTNPAFATYESRAGALMGTPYYMSPEQCEGRPHVDHRTDIYTLGVMLFEMLTGKTPYTGALGVVIGRILTARVPPVARAEPLIGFDPPPVFPVQFAATYTIRVSK